MSAALVEMRETHMVPFLSHRPTVSWEATFRAAELTREKALAAIKSEIERMLAEEASGA